MRHQVLLLSMIGLVVLGCAAPTLTDAGPAVESGGALGAGTHTLKVEVGGHARDYLLYVPPEVPADAALPVVLMLHGGGGSARNAMARYGWREKAAEEGFLVVCPQGLPRWTSRPGNFASNPRFWNDGSGRGHAGRRDHDDVGYIEAVLDDVERRCKVDKQRVYCTGFSMGASMTFRLAIDLNDRLAAVAPVSGHHWMLDAEVPAPLPMYYIIGTADEANPLEGGTVELYWGGTNEKPPIQQSIDWWIAALQVDDEPEIIRDKDGVKIRRYAGEGARRELRYCTIEGLDHSWPGSRKAQRGAFGRTPAAEWDATDEIWAFFARHARE